MNKRRKIPSVNLRERKLKSGKIQLYLDITIDGTRKRESLNLFLEDSRTKVAREKNRETLAIANEIAEKRRKEEIARSNGIDTCENGMYTRFYDYYLQCANKHQGSTLENWMATFLHIKIYDGNENLTLTRVNKEWLEGFKRYLLNDARHHHHNHTTGESIPTGDRRIKANTADTHFCRVITCLNWAVKDGLIQTNPSTRVDKIKHTDDKEREYLTKDELTKLLATEMPEPMVRVKEDKSVLAKRAIIFSFFTGLRMSDVRQVAWPMISISNEGRYRITFRQQKTKGLMYLDINRRAAEQLGERKDSEEAIFGNISDVCLNKYLKRWIDAAGIKKHITFHCCRHTFATLTLQAGADLYTTSKLLGHTNITTTQIYAKIVDDQKQKAVDKLDEFI